MDLWIIATLGIGASLVLTAYLLRSSPNKWPFFFELFILSVVLALQSRHRVGRSYSRGFLVQITLAAVFFLATLGEAKFGIWEKLGQKTAKGQGGRPNV